MFEDNLPVNDAATATASPVADNNQPQTNPGGAGTEQVSKPILNPEQKEYVKELMRKRVERSHNRFFERYGVKDLAGLDEKFANADKFGELNSRLEQLTSENASLNEQIAFLRNNINPDKYEDIRRYFKGGDVQFSEASLLEALTTHPEWIKNMPTNNTPKTTITTLSPERGHTVPETDDEKMKRIFGV